MANDIVITTTRGRVFTIRTVARGYGYGVGDAIVHDKDDQLIEFYDRCYTETFGPRGQFVARYYASTLAHHTDGAGLSLDSGIPEWSVDADALAPVLDHARTLHGACSDPNCQIPALGNP